MKESGKTAMWVAYDKNHQQILELLLSYPKVDVNVAANDKRQTLLTRTVEIGNSDLLKKILEHPGIDVNKGRFTYGDMTFERIGASYELRAGVAKILHLKSVSDLGQVVKRKKRKKNVYVICACA